MRPLRPETEASGPKEPENSGKIAFVVPHHEKSAGAPRKLPVSATLFRPSLSVYPTANKKRGRHCGQYGRRTTPCRLAGAGKCVAPRRRCV